MSEKLSNLMFQFIVDKGLRSEWDMYFEANQPDPEDLCPDCNGSGEHIYGGSFGGPITIQKCLACKGLGLKPKDVEEK